MTDRDDLARRNILDGDPFLATSPSWRFRKSEVEPYMPAQAPGAWEQEASLRKGWSNKLVWHIRVHDGYMDFFVFFVFPLTFLPMPQHPTPQGTPGSRCVR